jgi:hypothetical protein
MQQKSKSAGIQIILPVTQHNLVKRAFTAQRRRKVIQSFGHPKLATFVKPEIRISDIMIGQGYRNKQSAK